ncbi:MAG: phosphodiester glycosidase family protein [Chloroflexaceae bacterium]
MSPRTVHHIALVVLASLGAYFLFVRPPADTTRVLSRWAATASIAAAPAPQRLVGRSEPQPALTAAGERLAAFNRESALQEQVADGLVEFYRRGIGGGELLYTVARLDERVHIEVINADGAIPGSDASGDTIWLDGQRHLQPVVDMVNAPFAAREGMELLWAMAFGFHGAVRTSNEGSVVINGVVHRVNPWRGALCITDDGRALIDLFDAQELRSCWQAVGGGPVILWKGRIANPVVSAATDEFLPFNPLGEDFVQLDWRITVYSGTYPKTAVCVGDLPGGRSFLVLATSAGITGVELARALRDMGCHDALGGDDDTSTQAVWRDQALWPRPQRPVPDAIAVYVRQ